MLHPTFTITVSQRLAARDSQDAYEASGPFGAELARAIRMARQAESFPNSYTSPAVEVSERIIRACAAKAPLGELAAEAEELLETGAWYR